MHDGVHSKSTNLTWRRKLKVTKIMVHNTKQGATRRNWEKRNEAEDTTKKQGFLEKFEIQRTLSS